MGSEMCIRDRSNSHLVSPISGTVEIKSLVYEDNLLSEIQSTTRFGYGQSGSPVFTRFNDVVHVVGLAKAGGHAPDSKLLCFPDEKCFSSLPSAIIAWDQAEIPGPPVSRNWAKRLGIVVVLLLLCLLYTSDAADE